MIMKDVLPGFLNKNSDVQLSEREKKMPSKSYIFVWRKAKLQKPLMMEERFLLWSLNQTALCLPGYVSVRS